VRLHYKPLRETAWKEKAKDFHLDIELSWSEIKELFKTMKKKYQKGKDHSHFDRFLGIAKEK